MIKRLIIRFDHRYLQKSRSTIAGNKKNGFHNAQPRHSILRENCPSNGDTWSTQPLMCCCIFSRVPSFPTWYKS